MSRRSPSAPAAGRRATASRSIPPSPTAVPPRIEHGPTGRRPMAVRPGCIAAAVASCPRPCSSRSCRASARGSRICASSASSRTTASVSYLGTYTAFSGADARSRTAARATTSRRSRCSRCAAMPRRQQGHGAVPAPDRRPLCDARAAGQREYLAADVGRPLHLGWRRRRSIEPKCPWEFVQMGNCGSPIEIDEGWLVLTHGVGSGAQLLHRRVPARQGRPVQGARADADAAAASRARRSATAMCPTSSIAAARWSTIARCCCRIGVADNFAAFATVDVGRLLAAMA